MKTFITLALFLGLVSVASATVVDIPGCTDETANNYNSLATIDDGSCLYPSRANADPWKVGQVAWGGLNGYQITEKYITLKTGQSLSESLVCPVWFISYWWRPADCWTFLLK